MNSNSEPVGCFLCGTYCAESVFGGSDEYSKNFIDIII